MLTSNFNNIDVNQIATDRQVYGVACHFAAIHAKSPSERYGLTKVFNAVVKKYYSDADSFMTHGDVSEFREWECVPPQFLLLVANKKPKVKAKPKAAKKAEAKPKPVAKKAKPASKKPAQDDRVTVLEAKVEAVDAKLDAILAILAK